MFYVSNFSLVKTENMGFKNRAVNTKKFPQYQADTQQILPIPLMPINTKNFHLLVSTS